MQYSLQKIHLLSILLFSIIFSNTGYSKTNEDFDSIIKRMKKETKRQQIESCLDINELSDIDPNLKLAYIDTAIIKAQEIGFDSLFPLYYSNVLTCFQTGDFKNSLIELDNASKYCMYTEDPISKKVQIENAKGAVHYQIGNKDSAYYYYNKAQLILADQSINNINIREQRASLLTNLGNIYLIEGLYSNAIKHYRKSLKISKKVHYPDKTITLSNLSNCYKDIEDLNNALKYANEAIDLADFYKERSKKAQIKVSRGHIFLQQNKYELARKDFNESKQILEKEKNKQLLNHLYLGLGEIYYKGNKKKKADKYFNKALEGVDKLEDKTVKSQILITYGGLKLKEKDYLNAKKLLSKGLQIAQENNLLRLKKEANFLLLKIKFSENNHFENEELLDNYVLLKDSLFSFQTFQIAIESDTKYETDKNKLLAEISKQKANQLLLDKNIIQAKKEQQELYLYIALFGIISLVFIILYFFQKNRTKKREIVHANQIIHIEKKLKNDIHHQVLNISTTANELIHQLDSDWKTKFTSNNNNIDNLSIYFKGMNSLHSILHETEKNTSTTLLELCRELKKIVHAKDENIIFTFNEFQRFNLKSPKNLVLGHLIIEFTINALKHAFIEAHEPKEISVNFSIKKNQITCLLTDSGSLKKEINPIAINNFIAALNAKKIESSGGSSIKIHIPI